MHGIIGGKNNEYVDAVRSQFSDSKSFIAKWLNGLLDRIAEIEERQLRFDGHVHPDSGAHDIARFLKDPIGQKYTFVFLRRNFYRQFNARTRFKPPDNLWSIWFGGKGHVYGVLIAPAFRNGKWTNDKSEMRRAPYVYWTVGHVLSTGLATPEEAECLTVLGKEGRVSLLPPC